MAKDLDTGAFSRSPSHLYASLFLLRKMFHLHIDSKEYIKVVYMEKLMNLSSLASPMN